MARVVRPGGRVVILEITTPRRPPLSWFYAVWFDRIVPLLGTVAGDRDAYTYLPELGAPLPAGRGARSADARCRACATSATSCWPAASSRSTPATVRRMSTVDEVILLGGERMPALMERVERLLEETSAGDGPTCRRAASDTLAAGGKRLRPLLVLICGGARDDEPLVRAAAAVELIHMATLVHDDVVDDALLRRGRPTVFATRRPRGRDRDRRLPVLALVRAARVERGRRAGAGALRRVPRARPRRARPAPRCLPAGRRTRSATSCAASSRRRACSPPPAGSAHSRPDVRPRRRGRSRRTAAGSAWRSSCSTTCST